MTETGPRHKADASVQSLIDNSDKIKVLVSRAWTDVSPKVYGFLTGGTAVATLAELAKVYLGIDLSVFWTGLLVAVAGSVVGYLRKDTATVAGGELVLKEAKSGTWVAPEKESAPTV